ncbi:hypothetical protein E2562_028005 [Oryza meyeriana var. granulata]|uniref:Uncharacterized protein n=1 Tax=Oryza meyeriana var. granulata TaxID=110450 RepID=A0A6G1CU28_9ORYZ|nr:hypothetical protein E2562_028005 [Oryza meyeriana var. granulata]
MAMCEAAIEVAASHSSLASPPFKPPLRFNPATLLRHTTQPTTSAAAGAPSVDWLISFLSSLIPYGGRPKKPSPPTAVAALRRTAEKETERQLVGCTVPLFWPYMA